MQTVTQKLADYVKGKGINLSKMSRETGIPYTSLWTSLADEERGRDLRADEFLNICIFLDVDPRKFAATNVERG